MFPRELVLSKTTREVRKNLLHTMNRFVLKPCHLFNLTFSNLSNCVLTTPSPHAEADGGGHTHTLIRGPPLILVPIYYILFHLDERSNSLASTQVAKLARTPNKKPLVSDMLLLLCDASFIFFLSLGGV